MQRAVAYLNIDMQVRGNYSIRGVSSPLLHEAMVNVAKKASKKRCVGYRLLLLRGKACVFLCFPKKVFPPPNCYPPPTPTRMLRSPPVFLQLIVTPTKVLFPCQSFTLPWAPTKVLPPLSVPPTDVTAITTMKKLPPRCSPHQSVAPFTPI